MCSTCFAEFQKHQKTTFQYDFYGFSHFSDDLAIVDFLLPQKGIIIIGIDLLKQSGTKDIPKSSG